MKSKTIFIHLLFLLCSFSISAQINFIEDTSQSFEGAAKGSLAFADIDNDGDQDFLTTGLNINLDTLTTLYKNDGLGNFTKVSNTPFENMIHGDSDFGDIDNDGDVDLIITGLGVGGSLSTKLFINDGLGNFMEVNNTLFETIERGKLAFADLDNDGDQDLILSGFKAEGGWTLLLSKIYFNDGQGNFYPTSDDLTSSGSFDLADVDGDEDLDILIEGSANPQDMATLFLNDGNGGFSESLNTSFIGPDGATINFADIDDDTDMDVLITGLNEISPISKLYINDGLGAFTEATDSPISVHSGACGFADIDSDQDLEMLITGQGFGNTAPISILYSNDGSGLFSEVSGLPFIGIKEGDIEFVDVDGDSDKDLFITGFDATNTAQAKLYLNDFTLSTTESSVTFFPTVTPNPFDKYFNLNIDKYNGRTTIKLFNILGQIVLTKNISFSGDLEIPTAHLQRGLYFLEIKNGKGKTETISIYKN